VFVYHLSGDVLRHTAPGAVAHVASNNLFAVAQVLNVGVPLFFAISGFILGAPFAAARRQQRRPVSLKKYFLRRITRLEPPYILSLLIFFALKIAAGKGAAPNLFPHLLASLFYVHNLAYGLPSVINGVAWSLEIEVQFYILAPVLAMVFAVRGTAIRRVILAALLLLSTAVSGLVSTHTTLQFSLLGFGQYFLVGFVLVEFFLSGGDRRQGNWRWDVVSLLGWPIFIALRTHAMAGMHTGGFIDSLVTPPSALVTWVTPWLVLVLYWAAFHGVAMNRFVTNPWIATIGGMCYTIYLLHNYLIAGLGPRTESFSAGYPFAARLAVQFILMTPVLLLISGLYFRLVERPCMRPNWPRELKSRLWPEAGTSSRGSAA
jgi:peptidoglycan/LPS O-acetylase OafA/YrhL